MKKRWACEWGSDGGLVARTNDHADGSTRAFFSVMWLGLSALTMRLTQHWGGSSKSTPPVASPFPFYIVFPLLSLYHVSSPYTHMSHSYPTSRFFWDVFTAPKVISPPALPNPPSSLKREMLLPVVRKQALMGPERLLQVLRVMMTKRRSGPGRMTIKGARFI